jgi:hypothetical protein
MRSMSAIFVALVGGTLGIAGVPTASQAASFTFVQDSDHCTGGCGITTNNFITVSDTATAGVVDITAQLATGWHFISSGTGGGIESTLAFSSDFANLVLGVLTAGFGVHSPSPTTSIQMDGLVFPTSAYGVDWLGGNGAGNSDGSLLHFTATLAGLTATTFVNALNFATQGSGTSTSLWAADVLSANGLTGVIDFGAGTVSQVPLPPAILLFGTALVGMGLLRRRRKNGSAQAA